MFQNSDVMYIRSGDVWRSSASQMLTIPVIRLNGYRSCFSDFCEQLGIRNCVHRTNIIDKQNRKNTNIGYGSGLGYLKKNLTILKQALLLKGHIFLLIWKITSNLQIPSTHRHELGVKSTELHENRFHPNFITTLIIHQRKWSRIHSEILPITRIPITIYNVVTEYDKFLWKSK